ncbi:hypothetical protein [Cupriavidus sp. PET2-C1]
MRFDIIILKPADRDAKDLNGIRDVAFLGDAQSVRGEFDAIFPGVAAGIHFNEENFSLDVSLDGDPVTSAHMALRFGASWSEAAHHLFVEHLARLCRNLHCVVFAAPDNSRLAP